MIWDSCTEFLFICTVETMNLARSRIFFVLGLSLKSSSGRCMHNMRLPCYWQLNSILWCARLQVQMCKCACAWVVLGWEYNWRIASFVLCHVQEHLESTAPAKNLKVLYPPCCINIIVMFSWSTNTVWLTCYNS